MEAHPSELLDLEIIEIWAGEKNRLAPGLHLCPQIPVCLGGGNRQARRCLSLQFDRGHVLQGAVGFKAEARQIGGESRAARD